MGRILIPVICAVVAFSTAEARPRAKATPLPAHETLISSVAGNAVTISEDGSPKTFSVTSTTEIFANGQRVTFADLVAGMRVSVTLSDPVHARRIEAWNSK